MTDFTLGDEVRDGRFVRQDSAFRDRVDVLAAPGRYHLYVAPACPWSQRVMIVREVLGLGDRLSMSWVAPYRDERGWAFPGGEFTDPLHGWSFLAEGYELSRPGFEGRVTVPALWDRVEQRIVNNESADLVRMLGEGSDLYPADLADEIDAVGARVYDGLQNAVYQAGFASSQEAYEAACRSVFDTLAWLEERLAGQRYLAGDRITEADWRLFPTLVRFDSVYVDHFRCNLRRLVDHPHLWGYTRELYQRPGVAGTTHFDQIKEHYYTTHDMLEPSRIVPLGPELDFAAPHGRDAVGQAGV